MVTEKTYFFLIPNSEQCHKDYVKKKSQCMFPSCFSLLLTLLPSLSRSHIFFFCKIPVESLKVSNQAQLHLSAFFLKAKTKINERVLFHKTSVFSIFDSLTIIWATFCNTIYTQYIILFKKQNSKVLIRFFFINLNLLKILDALITLGQWTLLLK